jgi:Mg-chelatase subunit ChlD
MADMAITHAHPTATWTAATLATLISLCVESSPAELSSKIDELLRGLNGSPIAPITSTLGNSTEAPLADLARRSYLGPTCESLLPIMFAAACTGEDPAAALRELAASGAPTPVVAVAGAVLAARHGVTRFPKGWTDPTVKVTSTVSADLSADHIWMLLDRSGSMKAIREAMEHGIDQFIDEQRTGSTTPTGVTIIQFDDQNPHEIVVDAPAISGVPSLKGRLHPRGMTPLYDAIGHLLDRAEQDPRTGEQKLVVIITDGLENASRSVTQATIFDRIAKLEDKGWTFVFLGANQDSYAAGSAMRISDGNISNFTGSREGVERAYAGLSRATTEWRGKEARLRYDDRREFWGGVREAEEI